MFFQGCENFEPDSFQPPGFIGLEFVHQFPDVAFPFRFIFRANPVAAIVSVGFPNNKFFALVTKGDVNIVRRIKPAADDDVGDLRNDAKERGDSIGREVRVVYLESKQIALVVGDWIGLHFPLPLLFSLFDGYGFPNNQAGF